MEKRERENPAGRGAATSSLSSVISISTSEPGIYFPAENISFVSGSKRRKLNDDKSHYVMKSPDVELLGLSEVSNPSDSSDPVYGRKCVSEPKNLFILENESLIPTAHALRAHRDGAIFAVRGDAAVSVRDGAASTRDGPSGGAFWAELAESGRSSPSDLNSSEMMYQFVGPGDDNPLARGSTSNAIVEMYRNRSNHSEIEKRRRDKMNASIAEIAQLITVNKSSQKRLDKISVLKAAVAELRNVTNRPTFPRILGSGSGDAATLAAGEAELRRIVLQMSSGFVVVAEGDRGQVLHASESVKNFLGVDVDGLVGRSLFDVVHPNDIAVIKHQFSCDYSGAVPRLDLRKAPSTSPSSSPPGATTPDSAPLSSPSGSDQSSNFVPGARRAFFVRMKILGQAPLAQPLTEYVTLHCQGFLKTWDGLGTITESGDKKMTCLTLVARIPADAADAAGAAATTSFEENNVETKNKSFPPTPRFQRPSPPPRSFASRHTPDGKYVWADPSVFAILGYLPQEMPQTSIYERCADDEGVETLTHAHDMVLDATPRRPYTVRPCRLRRKDGRPVWISITAFAFTNPSTKEIEFFCAKNTMLTEKEAATAATAATEKVLPESASLESVSSSLRSNSLGSEDQDSHDDAGLRRSRGAHFRRRLLGNGRNGGAGGHAHHDAVGFYGTNGGTGHGPNGTEEVQFPSSLPSTMAPPNGVDDPNDAAVMEEAAPAPASAESLSVEDWRNLEDRLDLDLEQETTMAFIMQILEADAGLGGTVDTPDFPWPWTM